MSEEREYFKLHFDPSASPREMDVHLVNQLNAYVDAQTSSRKTATASYALGKNVVGWWEIESKGMMSPTVREVVSRVAEHLETTLQHIESIQLAPVRWEPTSGIKVSPGGIIIPGAADLGRSYTRLET